ncbi:MAG: hypothetical protein JXQ73_00950 [Phycisphaerae bacterium]|nr:hypothetical protein [Phycisphaerae bacterium]
MRLLVTRRMMVTGVLLTTMVGVGGCSAFDLISLLGGLVGIGGSSSTSDTDSVYFSVYNFQKDADVRAEITYRDRDGVAHTRTVVTDAGASPIPELGRGALDLAVEDLTTTPDALINVTLTFPDAENVEVTLDIRREWVPTNARVRVGVVGPDADSVGWFVDG